MHNPANLAARYPVAAQGRLRENIVSIQFLRFVAATLVVGWHAIEAINLHFPGIVAKNIIENGAFGASGVHIFFVISGFIMVYTSFYKDDDHFSARRFLSRRIIRIYPIYFVYCALYIVFYHLVVGVPLLPPTQLVGSLLLLPGYSSRIIGPGWTLAYEVYFYLCFSVAMLLGLKRGMLALTAFFLMSVVSHLFIDTRQQVVFVVTNSLLVEFLFGAWIGYAVIAQVRVGASLASAALGLAIIGFAGGAIFGFDRMPSVLTWGIPSALLIAGMVFVERNGRLAKGISGISFLGDSSYSLYLLHVLLLDIVIFSVVRSGIGAAGSSQINVFATILIIVTLSIYCIVTAIVAYNFIERRLIALLRDVLRRTNSIATMRGKIR